MIASMTAAAGLASISALLLPPLQPAPAGKKIDPIRLATVRRVDGRLVRTSEWIPYRGNLGPNASTLVFDCAQVNVETHELYGGTECGWPDLYRVFFGTSYYAPSLAEDMEFDSRAGGRVISEYDVAWYLGVDTPIEMSFAIAFFTYNELIDRVDCASTSVGVFPDDFTPASDGVVADFGRLSARRLPPFYYYAIIDGLNELEMLMPDGRGGTYAQSQLWIDTATQDIAICPGPCSPMFWGTSDDGGIPYRPGTQDIQIYLDDGGGLDTPDGAFDPQIECYEMSNGQCTDPWGNTGAFWIRGLICAADHNADGFITGIDYDLFVRDLEAGCRDYTPPCTNTADFDRDGFVTGTDFDLFVADFENGCR